MDLGHQSRNLISRFRHDYSIFFPNALTEALTLGSLGRKLFPFAGLVPFVDGDAFVFHLFTIGVEETSLRFRLKHWLPLVGSLFLQR